MEDQATMPSLGILFARFGLALVLGFLIGLERERDKPLIFAGMRTIALISLLGATLAFVSEQFTGYWLFVVGFMAIAAFALVSHIRGFETGDIGITTEVATLLAFLLGALVYWDLLTLAAAATVGVILVLNFKPNLQEFLKHVDRQDIWAGLEFAIVWVIVLPILPNRTYGPFDVLNPREIWLMVVLVAGINLAGYVLSQIYGAQRSIGIMGLLGGMISSTAVTFEFARRSKSDREKRYAQVFALAITVASTGMFVRALILASVLNLSLGRALVIPMAVGALVSVIGVGLMWLQVRRHNASEAGGPSAKERRSPFALLPALQFGVLFAVILLLSKAAQVYLGDAGAYLSSLIGGVAGMDAVTLSMAKLSGSALSEATAARSVTLGASANMLFKGAVAFALGNGAVRREVLPLFILVAAASVAAAFLLI